MNVDDKKLGQNIFIQSIEKSINQRQKFIKHACSDNNELYQYVMDLLKAHDSAHDYFDDLESSISSSHLNEIEDHLFRDINFGKYQIVKVLKQGGMGTIFLARRSDGEFKRTVVIKMIPIDLDFKQSQEQFAHEKKILASLTHPNIVQLYDSGITEKGHSYFVMELVKGKTIIEHCNDNQLNIEKRIDLFKEVLNAVAYAHQHLIIHGDIKPSNIMINEQGQVKLLDFGIARLVNKNNTTIDGFSLNYLTPEHQSNQPIITTTDIHQLGQLLFELLTNMEPKSVRNVNFEFPLLSSVYVNMESNQILALLFLQSSKKRKLKNIFNSDLQYILSHSLSVNPHHRYSAIQTFIDDISSYTNGYCINARPHTFFYKSSQYIKRNAMFTAFIVSMFFSSLAFVVVSERHNTKLALERDKALTVKNLITDVFSAADPSYLPGKELTAVEVLDVGLQRVRARFKTHSDIETDLLQAIAHTYQNLGKYEKAQNILKEVYETRILLEPDNEILKATTMLLLGENARLMSNNEEAKQWLLNSLAIFNQNPNQNLKNIASLKSKLGRVMVLLGELEKAEGILNQATELTLSIYGENTYEYAQALNDLNSVYFRQGKYQLVQQRLTQTKQIRELLSTEQNGPILDKDYATNINNLGLAYYLQGKLIEGEKYFRMANELRDIIYTKPHPEQAQSLTNLGLLLNDAGRPDEALPYLKKALEVRESTLNIGHMRINDAKNNLAMIFHENKQYEKAESIFSEILKNATKTLGEKSPQVLSIMTNRANTLLELNQFDLAKKLFQKSLDYRLESLPPDHLYLSYSYIGLGISLLETGEIQSSIELLKKALEIRSAKLTSPHWLLGEAQYAYALANFLNGYTNIEDIKSACHMLQETKSENHLLNIKCMNLHNQASQMNSK